MKAQIEKFVLFVCLKELLFVFMYFMVINKLYNQPDEKDMMCNMIHKTVTKCIGKYIVTIPFILYIFKNIYILGR